MNVYNFFQESKYIIVQDGRIFIDICEHGCGSGCIYCYAPYHNASQRLLNKEQIGLICKYIKDNYNCSKTIISLCPNTEPLKSKESVELILYIINFFADMDCYIQISTKEIIPKYFLEELHDLSKSKKYINISVPVIKNSKILEPNAASIEERFSNFMMKNIYSNIDFCLYIKPFIMREQEYDLYVEYIKRYQIDTVCVGPIFNNDSEVPCISLYDKEKAQNF